MIVDAEVWHGTPSGMRRGDVTEGYITVRDVERLLEEAHARGWRGATEQCATVAHTMPLSHRQTAGAP